tara:strand:- start:6 stop:533 length:528 start_codon:yes stop_codon:yes gene_type:complete
MLYRDYRRIEGYEDYVISNYGEVISLKNGKSKIIKLQLMGGYLSLKLSKNGIARRYTIHVLVGNAFIGKRENGLTFDHIDRVRTNNRVDNIRLASGYTQAQNKNVSKSNKLKLKYISACHNCNDVYYWRVRIERFKKIVVDKWFNQKKYTLEDAIKFRDVQLEKLKSNTNGNEID